MAVTNSPKKILFFAKKIPTRLHIAVMLFFSAVFSYMLRVNMSINILAMVQPTIPNENGTLVDLPDYGPRYNWNAFEQSLILGSYFWGYTITNIPGGVLSERFGGKVIAGYSSGACAIVTALVPIAAHFSFWLTFFVRFITGFLGGILFPALHNLVSKWAPPDEKGKFIACLMGSTIGTVMTWSLAGFLIESIGWAYAFYIPAILAGIFAVVWFFIIYDSPSVHPRILAIEKQYIENSLDGAISKNKSWPPFISVISSIPFWSLLFLHYGNMWGLYFFITAAPKFMHEILGFNLSQAGILASLPYLVRFFSALVFGSFGDYLRRKNWMTLTMTRKSFCIFSHIIPGLFLISLTYVSDEPYVCVAIITLALAFNGSSSMTNLQNSQDLAPNFAGTLYGIINTIGTTAGFITPLVVAYFTQERNTIDEWNIIFIIGALAYILPGILFIIFGSGNVQKWNEIK